MAEHSVGEQLIDELVNRIIFKLNERANCKQRLMGLEVAANYLSLTPVALREKSLAGEIPTVRIDKKLRFDKRDLERFVDKAPRSGACSQTVDLSFP